MNYSNLGAYIPLGINIIPDFITNDEENDILSHIKPKDPASRPVAGRNRIERYGSSVPYNNYISSRTIPEFLDRISTKLLESRLVKTRPLSVTLNEYFPGQRIGAHVDSKESGEVITILCLLSDATMVFQKKNEEFSLLLPARSLVQLMGEIRWEWTHAIPVIENKRYSLVFRQSE